MKNNIVELENETRKKFNFLKKYYDKTWDLRDHTLHVGLFKNDKETLEEAYDNATEYLTEKVNEVLKIDKNSIILDVGCGAGKTLISLCQRYGCSGIGVDLSDEMIKDAEERIQKINEYRIEKGLPQLNVQFIQGSGSELNKLITQDNYFTHIISQDALLLVVDKYSLYKNLYRLLKKDGVLGIVDFLGESKKEEFKKKEAKLIYEMINWSESLSFADYKRILSSIGFNLISAEQRDEDMIKTYNFLANRMNQYLDSKDKTFKDLKERYESIVDALKNKKMGWGIFMAKK